MEQGGEGQREKRRKDRFENSKIYLIFKLNIFILSVKYDPFTYFNIKSNGIREMD